MKRTKEHIQYPLVALHIQINKIPQNLNSKHYHKCHKTFIFNIPKKGQGFVF